MLFKILNRLIKGASPTKPGAKLEEGSLERAAALTSIGDRHAAVAAYREYLKGDPYNVQVLNDLGACLADIGNAAEASATFELAYSLDDTFMPVVVNHAKMLNDRRRSDEAIPFLEQAKISDPRFSHSDAVYAGVCLFRGELNKARYFQTKAWLANFDNLRLANGHLFTAAYDDIDEIELAAEHRFWAETLRPMIFDTQNDSASASDQDSAKIRIGYWSPDMRNHSVRYFFRPLLDNHDPSKVEVFLYHDFHKEDEQTVHIKAGCEHFHDVYELSDADLHSLICSHRLDIFVELAGHTSHNRVSLLQNRFATVQVSALGYPPTTGLGTMDAKLLDRYVVTADSSSYYTERPAVMPGSFWCFDPMEDAPVSNAPPSVNSGFITFGCVGNTVKFNERILRCWRTILDQVPDSRLLIRSINFEDPAGYENVRKRLVGAGIDLQRVDLRKPEGGINFFTSYNEIDIVLDTFPFNGGTTTCFATYMGVPVISLFGRSLIARMGLSILSNLGVPELAVGSEAQYIEKAVEIAKDVEFLTRFKKEARTRFQQSSLGNGKFFAREFESVCADLLAAKKVGAPKYEHQIPLLPANEIVRRAYAVLGNGQQDAAARIIEHGLKYYPDSGSVHVFVAQQMVMQQRYQAAADHLIQGLDAFSPAEQIPALILLTRLQLLLRMKVEASHSIHRLDGLQLTDRFDQLQTELYRACCTSVEIKTLTPLAVAGPRSIVVLVPCDDGQLFDGIVHNISGTCLCPEGWRIVYKRCDEARRLGEYLQALKSNDADILVLVQKNVQVVGPLFFLHLGNALLSADVVGFAGAMRWNRMDWRTENFAYKAAGFCVPSLEVQGFVEIQWLGVSSNELVPDQVVLDGGLLAINCKKIPTVDFDAELIGAETLLEEEWTNSVSRAGGRLAVHRNLSVLIDRERALNNDNCNVARMHLADKYEFDPFLMLADDNMIASAPLPNVQELQNVVNSLLENST
jgi:protein O-GlcNAc transferase